MAHAETRAVQHVKYIFALYEHVCLNGCVTVWGAGADRGLTHGSPRVPGILSKHNRARVVRLSCMQLCVRHSSCHGNPHACMHACACGLSCRLSFVPPCVSSLPNLTALDISDNDLADVPPAMGELTGS